MSINQTGTPPTVYFARKIVAGKDIIENGAIRVENGYITHLGPKTGIRQQGDRILSLGDLILVPGFINIHANLEESALRGLVDDELRSPFSCRCSLEQKAKDLDNETQTRELRATLTSNECIANGITTLVTPQSYLSGDFLKTLKINIRSLIDSRTVTGTTQFAFARHLASKIESESTACGFSTPFLYSHHPAYLKEAQRILQRNRYHFQMILGESNDEIAAFHEQQGELFDNLTNNASWGFGSELQSPARTAITRNLIPRHSTVITPNYSGTDELIAFQSLSSTVAIAPRYSQLFDLRPFPVGVALDNRLNIAVCTGTPALNTMNLLDELYEIRLQYPTIQAELLFDMITMNPARALRVHHELGSLEVGKRAHIIGIRSNTYSSSPLEDLIQGEVSVEFVVIDGEELIVP